MSACQFYWSQVNWTIQYSFNVSATYLGIIYTVHEKCDNCFFFHNGLKCWPRGSFQKITSKKYFLDDIEHDKCHRIYLHSDHLSIMLCFHNVSLWWQAPALLTKWVDLHRHVCLVALHSAWGSTHWPVGEAVHAPFKAISEMKISSAEFNF